MRKQLGIFVFALAVACGSLGGGNGNNGGNGGTGGGGGSGGTGGTGGSGGSGGSGGAGGSGGTPDYVSGSRIKSRIIATPDGAKAFVGFYDGTLSTSCAFGRAGDDTVRCLPTNASYIGPWWGDSGCTTPLAYSTTGCSQSYVQKAETTNSCVDVGYYSVGSRTRIYNLGSVYSGTMVWVGSPGSCTMTTPPATYTLYTVGSEVPASSFAAGSVDIAP